MAGAAATYAPAPVFSNARASVANAFSRRADEVSAQVLLDTLNPVVDLSKGLGLFDAVYVRQIRLRNGVLEATGDTKIPAKKQDGTDLRYHLPPVS